MLLIYLIPCHDSPIYASVLVSYKAEFNDHPVTAEVTCGKHDDTPEVGFLDKNYH